MTRFLVFLVLVFVPCTAGAQTAPAPASSESHKFGSPCPYPETARSAHSEGVTHVQYYGADNGELKDVKVTLSSGYADLDDAAVQCVKSWRVNPDIEIDRFHLGLHEADIAWSIPAAQPDGKAADPYGVFVGRPHTCLQFYPRAEEEAGIQGTTTLRFTITEKGEVRDETVAQSSGNADLDDAALRCARSWRYIPAAQNGKPVAVPWEVSVGWKMLEPSPPATPPPAPQQPQPH